MDRLDYYGCLGVQREASQEEIKRAFRLMVRDSHPDLNPLDPDASDRLRSVIAAYRILGDPRSRSQYDHVDKLFGPRRICRDDVAQQKSAFWEERLYQQQRIHPDCVVRRRPEAKRPFLAGILLICLAALLLFYAIESEGFARNPFQRVPRWRMQTETLQLNEMDTSVRRRTGDDWGVRYWSNEYRLNSSSIARIELGRSLARLAAYELMQGNRARALSCADTAISITPDLPEVRQVLQDIRAPKRPATVEIRPVQSNAVMERSGSIPAGV